MFVRSLLRRIGLAKAPLPIRLYAAMGGGVGLVPLVGFAAWRNREKIAAFVQKRRHRGADVTASPTARSARRASTSVGNGESYAATGL